MSNQDQIRSDNVAIGDALSIPKDPCTTRLHFQNIDGASVALGGSWPNICDHWKRLEIDIALACEHKLDTTQGRVTSKLYKGARQVFGLQNYALKAASSPIPSTTSFKPGGTIAVVLGNVKGRIGNGVRPIGEMGLCENAMYSSTAHYIHMHISGGQD